MAASATTKPSRPALRHPSAGITVIELMVVLVMVAVGILALSGIQTHSEKDVYATSRRAGALSVAQTQMESKRAMGYSLAVSDTGQTAFYNWISVVDTVGAPGNQLNRITVTVTWQEGAVTDSVILVNMVSGR
ncbi:MAG: hypothetical protein ACRENS_06695 [Candidatus Eiseniibacteriota bacterium]